VFIEKISYFLELGEKEGEIGHYFFMYHNGVIVLNRTFNCICTGSLFYFVLFCNKMGETNKENAFRCAGVTIRECE
jgi:hypothetical protein